MLLREGILNVNVLMAVLWHTEHTTLLTKRVNKIEGKACGKTVFADLLLCD